MMVPDCGMRLRCKVGGTERATLPTNLCSVRCFNIFPPGCDSGSSLLEIYLSLVLRSDAFSSSFSLPLTTHILEYCVVEMRVSRPRVALHRISTVVSILDGYGSSLPT